MSIGRLYLLVFVYGTQHTHTLHQAWIFNFLRTGWTFHFINRVRLVSGARLRISPLGDIKVWYSEISANVHFPTTDIFEFHRVIPCDTMYRKVGRVGTGGASWDKVQNLENRESTARASFRWCRGSFRCFSLLRSAFENQKVCSCRWVSVFGV